MELNDLQKVIVETEEPKVVVIASAQLKSKVNFIKSNYQMARKRIFKYYYLLCLV